MRLFTPELGTKVSPMSYLFAVGLPVPRIVTLYIKAFVFIE